MPAMLYRQSLAALGSTRCFEQRRLFLASGVAHAYDAAEWTQALVVVERGRLELEWWGGARLCFEPGDTLCLSGLALSALRSAGPGPTLLLALRREGGLRLDG